MRTTSKQLSWFLLFTLLIDTVAEILTMQLPLPGEPVHLGDQFADGAFSLGQCLVGAVIGGFAAFRNVPGSRRLATHQIFLSAIVFVVVAYFSAGVLETVSIIALLSLLIVVAFVTILVAGQWMAPRGA